MIGVAKTCTFQIGPAPTDDGTTDLKRINVFGDGVQIARDMSHTNGYDYIDASMKSIQVYGALCDQIMPATIHDVSVNFSASSPETAPDARLRAAARDGVDQARGCRRGVWCEGQRDAQAAAAVRHRREHRGVHVEAVAHQLGGDAGRWRRCRPS